MTTNGTNRDHRRMVDSVESSPFKWRQADCLGCGQTVKRARDAWIQLGGTRSGSWLTAMNAGAGRILVDSFPPPDGEDLLLLGVAHHRCADLARQRLRAKSVSLNSSLPVLLLGEIGDDELWPDFNLPTAQGDCPFCEGHDLKSKEDIYPKWLLRELGRRGARIKRDGRWTTKMVGPTTPVCRDCNNTWMSTLENDTKDLLISLFDQARPINEKEQNRLSFWATKMALLLDAASPNPTVPRGFAHDLRIHKRPHYGIRVWMAAYSDPAHLLPVHPWLILSEKQVGEEDSVLAWCITFSIVRVVFQVLIPFYDGTLAPLEDFKKSVVQIWPVQESQVRWPPPYCFDKDSIQALAKRIYDNREPVVMKVTLTEAVVRRPQS